MNNNLAKRASASFLLKENIKDKPFSCLCAIVLGSHSEKDWLALSVNVKFLYKTKCGDQEVLLSRFIDKGFRSVLSKITQEEISITLNIFQSPDIENGDLYKHCFTAVYKTLVQLFPIELGYGEVSSKDFSLKIIGIGKEICTIDFSGLLIPIKELKKHLQTCLDQCNGDKKMNKLSISINNKIFKIPFCNPDKLTFTEKPLDSIESVDGYFEDIRRNISNFLYNHKRIDDRENLEIRPISLNYDLLDRCYNALFTRGETSVLAIVNKKTSDENNLTCNYSFPSFSVGEISKKSTKTRREIGHSFFVNQAFAYNKFSQSLFANAEVLSSNGSSSLASVCAISAALKNAGLLTNVIAGISFGCFRSFKNQFKIICDLLGSEDGFSEMDFKITGTENGINSILMDSKRPIPLPVINYILDHYPHAIKQVIQKINESSTKWKSFQTENVKYFVGQNGNYIKLVKKFLGKNIQTDSNGNINACDVDFDLLEKILNFFNSKKLKKNQIIYFFTTKTTEDLTVNTLHGLLTCSQPLTEGKLIKAQVIKTNEIKILEEFDSIDSYYKSLAH